MDKPYRLQELIRDISSREKITYESNTHSIRELMDNEARLESLALFIESKGLRRLQGKHLQGKRALLFETVHKQMLRISFRESKDGRLPLDEILQPLMTFNDVAGFCVEVLPKVRTSGVSIEHRKELISALAKKGYMFWDCTFDNIGLLDDGTPVVIDADAVIHESKMHDIMTDGLSLGAVDRQSATYLELFSFMVNFVHESIFDLSMFDTEKSILEKHYQAFKTMHVPIRNYGASQKKHLETLGLNKGEIKGVYDDIQLNDLQTSPNKRIATVLHNAVKNHGMFANELSMIIAQAIIETANNPKSASEEPITRRIQQLVEDPSQRAVVEISPHIQKWVVSLVNSFQSTKERK